MKVAALLLGLLFADPVLAEAPLLGGPLIKAVSTGMARYKPRETAHIRVTLVNRTGSSFSGTISGVMTGRGRPTGTLASIPITALAPEASVSLDMGLPLSRAADARGYFVDLQALDAKSRLVDRAAAAIAVESAPYLYPRYCFASQFTAGTDTAALVAALNAWNCNGLQFYDVGHRQAAPYAAGDTWTNLANRIIDRRTVSNYVAETHRYRMFDFLFADVATADSSDLTSGDAAKLKWGLFTSPTANIANMARYPDAPGTHCYGGAGTAFPSSWQSPSLVILDPTNKRWQAHLAAAALEFIDAFAMDGLNLDTLGDPACKTYRADGSAMSYASALGSVYSGVRARIVKPAVIQDELQEHVFDVLARNPTFYLSELHPNFAYPQTFALIATSADNIRIINPNAPPVFMIYSEEDYAQHNTSCSTAGGPSTCHYSNPGVIYKTDLTLASGAWPMDVVDGNDGGVHIVSNIYVPATSGHLAINPVLLQAEHDRRSFAVAYETLLRGGGKTLFDRAHPAVCLSGAACAGTGEARSVFLIAEARPGLQILQMLNYQQLETVADASDAGGRQPAPITTGAITVKMYYGGSVTGANTLWFASPDIDHGAPRSLPYQKGSDPKGNYVTVSVPSLQYWDMLWLELDALSTSDYATP